MDPTPSNHSADPTATKRGIVHGTLGPAAEDVRARILEEITSGALGPGERLGAERDMSVRYGVSRSTLRLAIDALESTGHLRRVRGRTGGTFVAERRVERDLTHITGLPAYLRRQGFEAGTRVLSARLIEADDETVHALELAPGALVFEIVRTRLADGAPVSLERARLPAERFPGLLDHSLRDSIYALMQTDYGVVPREAIERIEIVGAIGHRRAAARRAALVAVAVGGAGDDGRRGPAVRTLARSVPRRPRPAWWSVASRIQTRPA